MLAQHWAATSIYRLAAGPLLVAALATICVRFSSYANPAHVEAPSTVALGNR
jgi:hypothetical protein